MDETSKTYCFGCLSNEEEKRVQNYEFQCETFRNILQTDSILLCYLCKRIAQHADKFVQSVRTNQTLLENFQNSIEDTIKIVQAQTTPLVNVTQVPLLPYELMETDTNSPEETFMVISSTKSCDVQVKMEMKDEEYLARFEEEFGNEDDYSDPYVKEEDEFPLKAILKEEVELEEIDGINLLSLRSSLKKNKVKVKKKSKRKSKVKTEIPKHELGTGIEIKIEDGRRVLKFPKENLSKISTVVYITKKQCMEERAQMMLDTVYVNCPYKCEKCIKGFSFKGAHDRHMEKHNECMGDFECNICQQRVESKEKLDAHMKYHLIRYKCIECGLIRICRETIRDHYSSNHAQGFQLPCPQCDKSFNRRSSLRKHLHFTHGGAEQAECAYCHKKYKHKDVLRKHIVLKHPSEVAAVEPDKKYVCQECSKAFKAPSLLKIHSVTHSDRKDYYCVECDKSFKTESILKNHLTTTSIHVNNKDLPIPCEQCDRRFAIKRDLERHMNRIHLNIRPYECDKCDKAYTTLWGLQHHKRLHHEGYKRPMKFPCQMCDKVFDRNQILKSHIRTHTGERPYQCESCPAQFTQSNVLRTHVRLIHLKQTRDGRPKYKW